MKRMKDKMKTICISIIVAFGAAFAIMSFNEDVAVEELFQKIYMLVEGSEHSGFGVLEFMYGIGIALGITVFFNSLGRKKKNAEPTELQRALTEK